jgi:hypothetical protein
VTPNEDEDCAPATGAQLAALGRQLRMFSMPNTLAEPEVSELRDAIALARGRSRRHARPTAAAVRRNLISWETSSEIGNA